MKDKLLGFARAFESNTYIKAVSGAMTGLMPVMIVSSIASLVASINIGGSQAFMESVGILKVTTIINSMTIDIVSIYAAFLVGYKLAELKGKDTLNTAVMSTLAFFILTPLTNVEGLKGLATSNLGAGSMFVAIFGGLGAAALYIFLTDKKIVIKMPDSVPPVVSKSFSAIIPGLVIAVLFGILAMVFEQTSYGSLQSMLLSLVSIPLKALGSNIVAVMIIVAFIEFLWFFGMHGVLAVYPVLMLVFYQPGLENLAAFSQGLPLPHLFTMGFVLGNRGARSLAVSILCMFQAKSERLKAVGKLGFIPACFGISEPIKFGIPQVLNIKMLIPLMLTPAVSSLIAYTLTIIGFLPFDNGVSMPLGSPVIISGFFNYGWQGIVSQFLQLVACTLIYIPFIKAQDDTYLADEIAVKNEENAGATA
ncbi:PTS sugar transporter [Erysipelothrix larvae]|uniref:Permease IIC component n=1 Tax=Erysipelothrix larvae TaxID=1514105 RepID=A0A0X8H1U6_9FIRM|nr:PTS transporter subunit EIIC [Erysipelothrix larvae]AMC94304.1 PTS sugar transporter [Erysipelothrix larvae]